MIAPPIRVLYVEDHADFRRLVVEHLGKFYPGLTVSGVATAEEARGPIGSGKVDVLLLDLMLAPGGLSGGDFLAELRASQAGTILPVIILTAQEAWQSPVLRAKLLRPDGIVHKTRFEMDDLAAAVRAVASRT